MEMGIIIVTNDWSGLGFALDSRLTSKVIMAYKPVKIEEEDVDPYCKVGDGLVKKIFLDDIIEKREKYKDWYWIWDGNHNTDAGELLRKEGFKVFGGTEFTFKLEEDRSIGIKFAEKCGLNSPEQKDFHSVEEGIKFLEEHEEQAYVYKPDDEDSAYTTVPMSDEPPKANKEIQRLIKSLGFQNYVLQEKVKGIEVNVESWYIKGKPVFTFANLENKKLHAGDLGSAAGCCFDCGWVIENDCKLAEITVRNFDKEMLAIKYTGFADCNVIIGDYYQVYFLEFCYRFGYCSHPNLSLNLMERPILEVVADMIDGKFDCQFKAGFGASVGLFNDHYKTGLPLYVPDTIKDKFYLFDGYLGDDDEIELAGYGKELGIVCGHDYTPEDALKEAMDNADKIKTSNKYYRTDADSRTIPNSVVQRYKALQALKLL
jgi:phosphoribosylamine--glycine ligase